MLGGARRTQADVRLPWGHLLEIKVNEGVGREPFSKRVFDIAVSEVAWRLLRAGDRAVDVGANIGYMTSLFATRVGPRGWVDAFEPHPRIRERLQRNVARLKGDVAAAHVTVHGCALGERAGAARLLEPEIFGLNEGAATVAWSDDEPAIGFDVEMARLDAILDVERIALLKVDVEGFEPQVLAGAERLLATG